MRFVQLQRGCKKAIKPVQMDAVIFAGTCIGRYFGQSFKTVLRARKSPDGSVNPMATPDEPREDGYTTWESTANSWVKAKGQNGGKKT